MGGVCCTEGPRKMLTGGPKPAHPAAGKRLDSCEVLSERQTKGKGSILPNNTGQEPKDKYEMSQEAVGTGAFGTVRTGKNKKTGAVCAVKTIKKAAIPNMDAFLNEVEINTVMDHPNIVRLYETFEDKHQVYLVMEVCNGGELFDTIIDQGFFSERDAGHVIKQVVSAVYYMHSQNIAHRDLKPENFLLQSKGMSISKNTLKVIDFGIAKRFNHKVKDKGADTPDMTTMVGTAYYVSPEVLGGKYSEKCDVWSIGVILYILLSGSPPFGGESDEDIMNAVKRGSISFDLDEFARVSNEAKQLLLTMCTRDPKARPSAGQILNSPWIQGQVQHDSSPVGGAVLNKLKAFSSVNRFKKAALQIIAHRLDDKQIVKLRETFQKLDKNGDGTVTLAEMKEACGAAGLGKIGDMQKLFEEMDIDGSGEIGYTEFLAGMIDQKNYLQEELVWEAFRTFDRDGSGEIDIEELKTMLKESPQKLGPGYGESDVLSIFKEADRNNDGKISFEEFMLMLRSS
uniref:non-specific serine/threonine protein kinase n=1 Tax=Alexandrium catenella TaxID=2925 RepID=A0A7S1MKU5_ALECA|mmetsp:Transcript_28589/g.77463  ORF Transcript_28589/g.77463 Transcript_28589/m.77463 type:complete len:512 (+) Transcript_28589:143-1678(+)